MSSKPQNQTTELGPEAKSNLWFYPGEKLKQGEMRVTLMGTGWGNVVSPAQKGPSIFVELGNYYRDENGIEKQDSFVFDVGPGCILNYNAMEIPMSRMNHIFLSHLHMDHCSDLPFIYSFGPNLGDRYDALKIYGPSGPKLLDSDGNETDTVLGTLNLVKGMQQFTQWHTTSFKTMTYGSEESYKMVPDDNVFEFDYRICDGKVYESGGKGRDRDHVIITSFPAVHIIDGAVSYKLRWSPAGQDEYLVFVYSGDTLPSDFMIEYGVGADLLIHETAPSIELVTKGAGSSMSEAFAIVCNSHTPANSLGTILAKTKPGLGVTTHSPMDPRSISNLIKGVYKGIADAQASSGDDDDIKYQVGADLMVFNISRKEHSKKATITTRMSALLDRPWPVRMKEAPESQPPPLADQIDQYRSGMAMERKIKPEQIVRGNIFKHANYADQCEVYFAALDDKQDSEDAQKDEKHKNLDARVGNQDAEHIEKDTEHKIDDAKHQMKDNIEDRRKSKNED